jgi:hypothetical protein
MGISIYYARGRSGGIITGWNERVLSVSNTWSCELGMVTMLHSIELSRDITVMNIYDPYLDRQPYLERIFGMDFLRQGFVIVSGDLNFTIGRT